jgi:radical SAM protein with 4Fe4S-binding SPASM domain
VLLSYLFSRITQQPRHWGMPISIAIEPTTACNLRCPECPSGLRSFTRPTGKLKEDDFQQLIDQISPYTSYLTFYFQGEPYLNPNFLEMVRYAHQKKIYTATSTNAHFLDEKNAQATVEAGLDRLIISIDGLDQETYQSYRKSGHLEKVLEGTRQIIKTRKDLKKTYPLVIWQFLVVGPNEHQIPELYRLAQHYGVDKVVLKTAQIYDYENGNPLIPSQEKYARYKKGVDGKYYIKNQLLSHCWKMWSSCVITWDGKVIPCCFDKDAHHVLGELRSESFVSIWRSNAYKKFRKKLLKSRNEIEMCKNCTEGTKVWA